MFGSNERENSVGKTPRVESQKGNVSKHGNGSTKDNGRYVTKEDATPKLSFQAPDAASTLATLEFSSPPFKRQTKTVEGKRANMDIEDEDAIHGSPAVGSSCHQCKSRRSQEDLNWCANMFTLQRGKKRPLCRKKYCDRCIQKFMGEKPPAKDRKSRETWQCPACRGICSCAACRRRKARIASGKRGSPMLVSGRKEQGFNKEMTTDLRASPLVLGKRQRNEPSSGSLLKLTAAMALKTPASAPLAGIYSTLPMPLLNLGGCASPATVEVESKSTTREGRVAHINGAPQAQPVSQVSQVSTMLSIQQKLKRLSELSNLSGLGILEESNDVSAKESATLSTVEAVAAK